MGAADKEFMPADARLEVIIEAGHRRSRPLP
jgi:hypothetical protein